MKEIERIIRNVAVDIPKPTVDDCTLTHWKCTPHELAKAIEQYVLKARIEENEFYTKCPDKKTMNDAADYRIAELKKGVK